MPSYSRSVDVADIVRFRKADHPPCRANQGALVVLVNGMRTYRPCNCAVTRFKKFHGDRVEILGNDVRWKPGFAPPQRG